MGYMQKHLFNRCFLYYGGRIWYNLDMLIKLGDGILKKLHGFLIGLLLFVGIGALFGGGAGVLNPQNPLGAPIELLKNSPFSNFLIPGIILFAIVGLGSIAAALAVYFRWKYYGYISSVFSWALVIWIVVQCIMLRAVGALHIIFFMIGAIEALLSAIILFDQRLFPANLILGFYKRVSEKNITTQ